MTVFKKNGEVSGDISTADGVQNPNLNRLGPGGKCEQDFEIMDPEEAVIEEDERQ